ncbi:hypothetical protein RJ639_031716 [Escallonia herrerae]|uniref:AT-hook motif nuclear-localized protein n=1 Tax=Escallonia herrerae TaxID=1293975 RepID=A0AA89BBU9_9ASTE|nr:hypothetical protein RJ639_031716 [Escallonia herrerae]
MERTEGMNSGVTVIASEAPSSYHVAPRTENSTQYVAAPAMALSPVSAGVAGLSGKKKRGRPRKYGPDGPLARTLSPMPISASAPPATPPATIAFSAEKQGPPPPTGVFSADKPRKGRPNGSESKPRHMVGSDTLGETVACSSGGSFTPHMINVNPGEDVSMKIIALSQQGPRAICIISAVGSISTVTLRQSDSSGGTLTYEGRFEILSLSGSFAPTEGGGSPVSRVGGMSITLSSSDGRVVGGSLAGLLIAASPVQVVVGSFLTNNHPEPKTKKQKPEPKAAVDATRFAPMPHVSNFEQNGFHVQKSAAENSNFAPTSSPHADSWATVPSGQLEVKMSSTDINMLFQGD